MPENLVAWVPDPPGPESYPIVSFTWMLCRKVYDDPKIGETLKKVLLYGVAEGQTYSHDLGYVPLPESVVRGACARRSKPSRSTGRPCQNRLEDCRIASTVATVIRHQREAPGPFPRVGAASTTRVGASMPDLLSRNPTAFEVYTDRGFRALTHAWSPGWSCS